MNELVSALYERLVLRRPWLVLALVAVLVAGFATQLGKIKLDASADSLMLQGDPSLELYPEISAEYGSEEFVLITWQPHADLLAPECLHTYFRVGDIHQTRVHGLDGTSYLDKTRDFQQFTKSGPVTFSEETDRVYLDTTADCLIEDPVIGRTIRVAKLGSSSSVVWNPWSEKEKGFADMAAGEYANMVCVETVNASPDEITIQPGGKHSLVAFVGVE